MGSLALSFPVATWTTYYLICGILHTGTGIPLSDFYPFGASENDFTVGPTDDGSNSTMLDQEFPFFGETHDLIYINNNGIISFIHSFPFYEPKEFPLSSNRSFIAPFWADSDTRNNNGTIWFGIRNDDFDLLERARHDTRRYFSSQHNFDPNFLLVSTWEEVPHYRSGNKTNTYQCVLVSDGVRSFTFFHYADGMMEWTTGDVSGGMNGLGGREAEIGYDADDCVNYHSIYLSGAPEVINISSTSNVNRNGVWAFRIDEASVTCCDESTISVASISIITTSIVVVVLISISTLVLGAYCIKKWKNKMVGRILDNSAHVYEEVEGNIEMKALKRKDMPVAERCGEIGNVDINMNECAAYAVIKI